METPTTLLTIAGTDPSGGAGLPVDLQVFRDFGAHGLSVATAIVWQNTAGVRGFEAVPAAHVDDQLEAVFDDLDVAGIKIGMLAAPETAEVVAESLARRAGDVPVVLDPVLAGGAEGERLAESGLVATVRDSLLSRVDVVTPNLGEAEALLGREVSDRSEMRKAARELVRSGAGGALMKAGHLDDDPARIRDVFAVDRGGDVECPKLEALPRVDRDVRGTGCQLSSAIASGLAGGRDPTAAVESARTYLNELLRNRTAAVGRGRELVVRVDGGG